jgi:hypothetical protein
MSRRSTGKSKVEATTPSEPEKADNAATLTTQSSLAHVGGIVESCQAVAIFVYVDALESRLPELSIPAKAKVFCVARDPALVSTTANACVQRLRVSDVPLTRMGQVKIAVFLALSKGWVKRGGRIITEIQEPRSTGDKPKLLRTHPKDATRRDSSQ